MLKKILSVIISVIICGSLFTGCVLVEHNDKKDAQQVIATIAQIDHKDADGKVIYTSPTKKIYKTDLIRLLNSDGQNYMSQNQGVTLAQTVDAFLQRLTVQELLYIEVDRLENNGTLVWGQKQKNQKMETIYDSIDSQLTTIKNAIYADFDETAPDNTKEEAKTPTYPVKPAEETEQDNSYVKYDTNGNIIYQKNDAGEFVLDRKGEKIPEYIEWVPGEERYPAMHGSLDQQSLEREAVNRFINLIKDLVKDDFKVEAADKAAFAIDDKNIAEALANGEHTVYTVLGNSHYMEYLIGRNAKRNIQVEMLREYITEDVSVTEEQIIEAYDELLVEQKATYDANASAYETAIKDGKTTVLYNKTSDVFFVKHILLPFSDAQKAAMEVYKKDPNNFGKDYTAMRDSQMVNEMKVYAHKDGEDDKSVTYTAQQVFNEILGTMNSVAGNTKAAERAFDDFIYKYNTDPGTFNNARGYAVSLNGTNSYMKEFEVAAKKLRNEFKVGDTLNQMVVTDYGVHIMYFANTISAGSINRLDSYETPGKYKTYKELLEATQKTSLEDKAFEEWQNERIVHYENSSNVITKFEKRFKDLKVAK